MRVAIIGCGNMAEAVVSGMNRFGKYEFFFYTPSGKRAQEFAKKFSGKAVSFDEMPEVDRVIFACKPQQFNEMSQLWAGKFNSKTLGISLLAGVSVSDLQKKMKLPKIIRLMPNTPTLVGQGIGIWIKSSEVLEAHEFVSSFGPFMELIEASSEDELDFLSAFSASGPAFIFEWARILSSLLMSEGISSKQSQILIQKLFLGSATLMDQSVDSFETLRNKVTSPKGMTFEGLEVFRKSHLENLFKDVIHQTYRRSRTLGDQPVLPKFESFLQKQQQSPEQ